MCGRFSLSISWQEICKRYSVVLGTEIDWQGRYNIAPSQNCIVIIQEGANNIAKPMKWGLVPHWSKDPKLGYKMINARCETIDQKPSFKGCLARKRCIIPADGFYEWKKEGDTKQPIRICLSNEEPFAFAGLWDTWESPQTGEVIESFTIITTPSNSIITNIHDRMPAILSPEEENTWLNPNTGVVHLKSLLSPYPSQLMRLYPVSPIVNSWKNDVPECFNEWA